MLLPALVKSLFILTGLSHDLKSFQLKMTKLYGDILDHMENSNFKGQLVVKSDFPHVIYLTKWSIV